MNNQTRDIFEPLFRQINVPYNPFCLSCDAEIKHPLLPWIVGAKYWDTEERILFVGKPHRGQPGDLLETGILDSTNPHLEWLMSSSYAYWSYTRDIISNLYGKTDPWSYVAYTNIIKCTNVHSGKGNKTQDKTTRLMAKSCIKDNNIISKEIIRLEPKHIVFYTYNLYNEFIEDFSFEKESNVLSPKGNRVNCGKKRIGWWNRVIRAEWCGNVKCLVTHHPERKKKDEYIKLITDWVKS